MIRTDGDAAELIRALRADGRGNRVFVQELSRGRHHADLARGKICEPEITVRPRDDRVRILTGGDREFANDTCGRDHTDLGDSTFDEPDISVRPDRDLIARPESVVVNHRIGGGERIGMEGTRSRELSDRIVTKIDPPQCPVWRGRNLQRNGFRVCTCHRDRYQAYLTACRDRADCGPIRLGERKISARLQREANYVRIAVLRRGRRNGELRDRAVRSDPIDRGLVHIVGKPHIAVRSSGDLV